MALPVKQLFASFHLGIFRVFDLEPGCSFSFRDVGSEGMFGNDTFKIHFAHTLEQRCTVLLNVIGVSHPGCRSLGQKTPEFVLSVCQSFRPQVLAVTHQQVERKEAGITPVKKQVTELRSAPPVETANLSIEHRLAAIRRNQCFAEIFEGIEGMSVTGDEFAAPVLDDRE